MPDIVSEPSLEAIRELKDRTGDPLAICRRALIDAENNAQRAEALLKRRRMPVDQRLAEIETIVDSLKASVDALMRLVQISGD